MKRREFIGLVGAAAAGAAAWPLAVNAQQPEQVRRVGALDLLDESDPVGRAQIAAFRKKIDELGGKEGRAIRIDQRWASGDLNRARTFAKELVSLSPDVILARSSVMAPLRQETHTIPIVFVGGADPVAEGFVASLARPGGNITGFSNNSPTMATKRLQLLTEIAPRVKRIAYIYDPTQPGTAQFPAELKASVSLIGVQLLATAVVDAAQIEQALNELARRAGRRSLRLRWRRHPRVDRRICEPSSHTGGLWVPVLRHHRGLGVLRRRCDRPVLARHLLCGPHSKGEKPSDLPTQQPVKFELAINLKTAKMLGLGVPVHLQQLADEIIE